MNQIKNDGQSRRADSEIKFGSSLALEDTESVWGWGTPAGKLRAQQRAKRIIQSAGLQPGIRVLEIGCGTGMFTELFAATGANIVSVDISSDLLKKAELRGLPKDRVKFVAKRFEDLDSAEPFDAIIGSSVLHHLEIKKALENIFKFLKPGGWMSFAEPNMLNPQVYLERKLRFLPMFSHISPDETAFIRWGISNLLIKQGFVDITVKPLDWLHPSVPEPLIGSVCAIGSILESTPLIREISGSLYMYARKP